MNKDDREDLLEEAAEELRRGDGEESGGSGGGAKKLLMILLPLVVLGGGGGAYYTGFFDEKLQKKAEVEQPAQPAQPAPQKSKYFDLPDMLINMNSVGPKPSFLKLRASLELESDTDTTLLTRLKPRIIDKFNVYMRELRLTDLRASAGLSQLREELRLEINRAVSPIEVKQVLFRNILVQ